jgi:hypothetical protein
VKRRMWRYLVPAATAGLLAVAVPTALAGELDNDPDNNPLRVRMLLSCNGDSTVTLKWNSRSPREARKMSARWHVQTVDPNTGHTSEGPATPANVADQIAAVKRRGSRASGRFELGGMPNGTRILIAVDALKADGNQIRRGIGRNIDTVNC